MAGTRPLAHRWKRRWSPQTSPDGDAGVQFDPLTEQHPQNPATWTIWVGRSPARPT
ncbi:DUF317 domain-containing protein [Streptomyces sp. NPDC046465]|uniref:DUF317 domain-containing protein n=1 Tax=Streptomyces sp. NPDC046465 TaxID=3155810 RepID=UPI0033D5864E